jgi:hypothetical protein
MKVRAVYGGGPVWGPAFAGENYAALLRRAVACPEGLSAEDRVKLLPEDKKLIVAALDREIARADIEARGMIVRQSRVGATRRREMLAAARRGGFFLSALSDDEIRAVENTPGLLDEIDEASR